MFQGEMPNGPIVAGMIVTSPIWIPGLAIWGAYHGIKAGIVHGIVPGFKKIAGASRK